MGVEVLSDRAISGRYYQTLEQGAHPWIGRLAVEIPSDQDSENHVWLGMPPQMREWLGGKQANTLRSFEYRITNKDWESTMEYHERELAEDKTGQFQVRLQEHIRRIQSHPAKLLSQLIMDAESNACYDGQYFFDTDHSEGDSGSQSNDVTYDVTTTTAPTVGDFEQAILSSVQQMYSFKDDQGEPINEDAREFGVMVPIPFWKTAMSALGGAIIVDGSVSRTNMIVNQNEFKLTLWANPRLTWTTKFATFRLDGVVKPFIDQVRERPVVKVLGEGSDHYFETRRKRVSVEKAGNVGFGLWQGACLTTFV